MSDLRSASGDLETTSRTVRDRRVYLDHNANSPLRPQAKAAMLAAMEYAGVASSVHGEGRAARKRIEAARAEVAALVGVEGTAVTFTSGASEANATVLTPHWQLGRDTRAFDRLLVAGTEHVSVLRGARFPADRIEALPVHSNGLLDVDWLETRLRACAGDGERVLVSVMLANNETGVIQPLATIAALVHAHGGSLHSDVSQAAGKIGVNAVALGIDLLTLSGHKIGGPQGIGALVVVNPALHLREALVQGGGQEKGLRAGTENTAAIAGFGAAAKAVAAELSSEVARLGQLRNGLEAALGSVTVFGKDSDRLPNTLLFARDGVAAEAALIALDLGGVAVSSGSACSSGKVGQSHVLAAMGVLGDLARCAIRVSLGWNSCADDVSRFLATWNKHLDALSRRQREAA